MYPHIKLKITNHKPQIFFLPDEGMTRQLTLQEESIEKEIVKIAKLLGIKDKSIDVIFSLISEADNTLLKDFPEIDLESIEFNLGENLEKLYEYALEINDEYKEIEMSDEVRKELDQNKKLDILASLVDQIYNILVAKTLLSAYELEITDIHIETDYNYARLIEKMGVEVQKLDLEFNID